MTAKNFLTVTVYRVGESTHQSSTETLEAYAVSVDETGRLSIQSEGGKGASFDPGTWGHIDVERVPGRRAAEWGAFVGNG